MMTGLTVYSQIIISLLIIDSNFHIHALSVTVQPATFAKTTFLLT
jgi:hypothetical protein